MDHTKPLSTTRKHRPASAVFPTLLAPEDTGRIYQPRPTAEKRSTLASLLSFLRVLVSRRLSKPMTPQQAVRRAVAKDHPERGSGYW